ncbi:MAG: outer membrane protein assembly factor [Hyphomicrobiales bacterium]
MSGARRERRGPPRSRGSARALLAAALLVFAPALLPAPARAQLLPLDVDRHVGKVLIHGNEHYGSGTLRGLLRTRGGSFWRPWKKNPYRPDFVRFDRSTLQDFYRRHGYLRATVDSVAVRGKEGSSRVDVHFYLTEGPRAVVDSVRFEGAGPIPESALRKALVLRRGDPFEVPREDLNRQAVENQYFEKGYVGASVRDSLEIVDDTVGIVFRIRAGAQAVLGGVKVDGAHVTKPQFVTREITLHRGEIVARSKLLKSQQRIYDSGFYSDVQFDRTPIDSVTHATDLIVTVRERKMGWVDAGFGYGTVDQLRLTSQLGQRNLWHDGVKLVATGRLGLKVLRDPWRGRLGDRRLDVALSRPWIFGLRVSTAIGGYAENIAKKSEAYPIPFRAYGATASLGYDLLRHTRALLSLENQYVVSDTVSQQKLIGEGRQRYTTNRFVVTLDRDTRQNVFDPKAGSDLLVTSEFVGGVFQGNAEFFKFTGTATRYLPVGSGATLALRFRAGGIIPQGPGPSKTVVADLTPLDLIPVIDRYQTGGATTVRGYRENDIGTRSHAASDTLLYSWLGGRALLLANAELRFKIAWVIGGAVFLDAGNVWADPGDMKLRNILSLANGAGYNDMRYSVGTGIRFGTPIGPVRFDYGWKLRIARPDQPDASDHPGEFHFSVGQAY